MFVIMSGGDFDTPVGSADLLQVAVEQIALLPDGSYVVEVEHFNSQELLPVGDWPSPKRVNPLRCLLPKEEG